MTHRPTIYGTRHAVSAGHYLAAAAGFSILEAGGNAIDAGCAAGIALGVLQPDLVNVAGVAPIMIRLADGTVESIAGLGWWPKTVPGRPVHARARRERCPTACCAPSSRPHPTPGSPHCAVMARCASPKSPRPAIRFAAEGFAVYPLLAASIASHEHEYRRWPSNTAIFLPDGRVPRRRREIRAVRPGAHAAIHGGPGSCRRPRPHRRPERRARRLLSRRHRARDRAVPAGRRRLSVDGRPGVVSVTARAGGAPTLARPRADHLRPVVPGPGAAAGAGAGRAGRHRRAAAQFGGLPAPHRRVPEPRAGRPGIFFRRSGFRRCADRPSARSRNDRPSRRSDARRPRVRPDAGAARPAQSRAPSQCRGTAEGRGGYVVLLRGGSLGQRVQRHAIGRLEQRAGRAGAGHHAVRPRLAEPARSDAIRPVSRPASARA